MWPFLFCHANDKVICGVKGKNYLAKERPILYDARVRVCMRGVYYPILLTNFGITVYTYYEICRGVNSLFTVSLN